MREGGSKGQKEREGRGKREEGSGGGEQQFVETQGIQKLPGHRIPPDRNQHFPQRQ